MTTACACGCGGTCRAGRPPRKFASRACQVRFNVAQNPLYYQQIATKAAYARAARPLVALRPLELRLMMAARYREAAVLIYERGYGAGWVGRDRGFRQRKVI